MDTQERKTDIMHQLETFSEIGKTITSSLNLKEVLQRVMREMERLLKPDNWSLLLLDEKRKELRFEIAVGKKLEKYREQKLRIDEGLAGRVAREGKPIIVEEIDSESTSGKRMSKRYIACIPLKTRGRCLGVIELVNTDKGSFSDDEIVLLTTIADYTAIAIENAMLFKRVEELTITDDLTQLYNSRYMHKYMDYEIERCKRYGCSLSMIFMDIDYFKEINDRYGHICGSKLLFEFARVLKENTRSIDVPCRYGGDEFVILMPETPKDNALIVAEKLREIINHTEFLSEEGINCHVTASMGVASFPEDAKNKLELIHLADKAMYSIKNTSKNGISAI